MIRRVFRIDEFKTTPMTEVIAGLLTFMTMAYIIFVNPHIPDTATMQTQQTQVAAWERGGRGDGL